MVAELPGPLSVVALLTTILVVLTTILLRQCKQLASAAAATEAGRLERRQQAAQAWPRVVRTLLRLLSRRRIWHNLGEHLKSYTGIRSASKRHGSSGTGSADGRRA